MKRLTPYIRYLTGSIYQLLPLKEEADAGKPVSWKERARSICLDMTGAQNSFPVLANDTDFLSCNNRLWGIVVQDVDHADFRREILGILHKLNCIEKRYGDADG